MAKAEISLARILDLRVPVAWYEAVAVAQTVGDAASDYAGRLGPDNCVLTGEGSLQVYSESRRPFPQDPGAGALSVLLDRANAPNELQALCERYDAGDHAARDFAADIAFFTRPDAAASIASLVTRALALEAEWAGRSAFEQLRADAAQAAPPSVLPAQTVRQRKQIFIGAFATAGVAGLVALVVLTPTGAPAQVAVTTTSVLQTATASIDRLLDAGFTSIGLRAAAEAAPPPSVEAVPRRATAKKTVAPKPGTGSANAARRSPTREAELTGEATTISVTPVPPVDLATYGHEDATVDPPVLVRPQLPRPLGGPPPADGVHVEVTINPMGTVDSVHLRGAPSTFHDRMLLSAAKAWIFRPAYKDGQPVSYTLRVAVTP